MSLTFYINSIDPFTKCPPIVSAIKKHDNGIFDLLLDEYNCNIEILDGLSGTPLYISFYSKIIFLIKSSGHAIIITYTLQVD